MMTQASRNIKTKWQSVCDGLLFITVSHTNRGHEHFHVTNENWLFGTGHA